MRGKPAVWHRLKRRLTGTDEHKEASVLLRMLAILSLLLIGFAWVIGQAWVYQLSQGPILSQRGDKRVKNTYVMTGRRGRIVDRTGRGLLAVTVPSPRVDFKGAPYYVDRTELGFTLAEALDLKADTVITRIIAEENHARIKRNLTDEEVATIRKLNLPGVRISNEKRRFYPMGSVFGAELGYVKDGRGNRGIEAWYDRALRGDEMVMKVLRDRRRRGLYEAGGERLWLLDGADLVLSIDSRIQLSLESELIRRVQMERAVGGMAVVLDARTFQVLAMSSVPSLNPNRYEEECGEFESRAGVTDIGFNPCRNKVISYLFEPGSIAKIFAASAAFESGRIRPSTIVDGQNGRCLIGKHWVKDLEKLEKAPVSDAIKFSSNCAMAEVGERTGLDRFVKTMRDFGFGEATGIDMPGEAVGNMKAPDNWAPTWLKTASYGYGFKASLLQLAVGTATIANDGIRLTPRVALEVRSQDGRILKRFDAGEPRRVVSTKAARMVRDAMTAVVMEEDGTGILGKPEGYTAAAKTGTARLKWLARHGREKAYMTSYVGFAPASDPRIVVAVAIIDPRENRYGGTVAGPVFASVAKQALEALGVAYNDPPKGGRMNLADGGW